MARFPTMLGFVLCAGCASEETTRRLDGAIDATIAVESGATIALRASGKPAKFRSQLNDDGERCKLRISADWGDDQDLDVNTYSDEIEDLLRGTDETVAARDNRDRAIAINAATVYATLSDGSWYSRSGSVHIAPLPAPLERLLVRFDDVLVTRFDDNTRGTLDGSVELTYVGVVVTSDDGSRACPRFDEYPGGVVF